MEKIYSTMRNSGAINIATGIILIIVGISAGVINIVIGGKLLSRKDDLSF